MRLPLARLAGAVPGGLAVALGAAAVWAAAGCAEPPEPLPPAELASVEAASDECLRGDLAAGLASLDAVVARTPRAPDALVARGLCRWQRWSETDDADDVEGAYGDLSDAIAAVEDGAASGTPLDRIYSHRAFVAQALDGDWARTIQDLDRAAQLAPGNPVHVLDRGVVHAYAGDTAAARRDLGRYLATDSVDADRQRVVEALLDDLGPDAAPKR